MPSDRSTVSHGSSESNEKSVNILYVDEVANMDLIQNATTATPITIKVDSLPVLSISTAGLGISNLLKLDNTLFFLSGGRLASQVGTTTAPVVTYQPITTKGDLVTFGATTQQRFPVGADNLILTADSSTATGLAWKSVSSASEYQYYENDVQQSTMSATFFALYTIPFTMTAGNWKITWSFLITRDNANADIAVRIRKNNSNIYYSVPISVERTGSFITVASMKHDVITAGVNTFTIEAQTSGGAVLSNNCRFFVDKL